MRTLSKAAAAVTVVALGAFALTGCEVPEDTGSQTQSEVKSEAKGDKAKAEKPSMTKSQEQALGAAQDYLEFSGFSKAGLIDQLSSEYGDGFPRKDATWAVNHLEVDWRKQAVRSAKDYLDLSHFSRQGLIDQLSSKHGDKYTVAEATYAANQVGL
jgi:Host cell surface-exposed lipoprotein